MAQKGEKKHKTKQNMSLYCLFTKNIKKHDPCPTETQKQNPKWHRELKVKLPETIECRHGAQEGNIICDFTR